MAVQVSVVCCGCWEFLCSGCWEFLWFVVGVGSFSGVLWLLGVSVLWEFVWCVVAVGVCVVCCGCWSLCGVLGVLSFCGVLWVLGVSVVCCGCSGVSLIAKLCANTAFGFAICILAMSLHHCRHKG